MSPGTPTRPTTMRSSGRSSGTSRSCRELGIPVQTPTTGEDGYRIPPLDFALPPLSFTPSEAAALALAGRLWETTALATAGSGALRKIRDAAGPDSDSTAETGARRGAAEITAATPRCRDTGGTPQPVTLPFEPLVLRGARPAGCHLRLPQGPDGARRAAHRCSPGVWSPSAAAGTSIGHDEKRGERRTFRLSRISGPVKTVGRAGAVRPPAGVDLLAEVAASVERPADRTRDRRGSGPAGPPACGGPPSPSSRRRTRRAGTG